MQSLTPDLTAKSNMVANPPKIPQMCVCYFIPNSALPHSQMKRLGFREVTERTASIQLVMLEPRLGSISSLAFPGQYRLGGTVWFWQHFHCHDE